MFIEYNVKFHSASGNQTDLLHRLKKTKLARVRDIILHQTNKNKQSNISKKKRDNILMKRN